MSSLDNVLIDIFLFGCVVMLKHFVLKSNIAAPRGTVAHLEEGRRRGGGPLLPSIHDSQVNKKTY